MDKKLQFFKDRAQGASCTVFGVSYFALRESLASFAAKNVRCAGFLPMIPLTMVF
jgi:hypothetical protein